VLHEIEGALENFVTEKVTLAHTLSATLFTVNDCLIGLMNAATDSIRSLSWKSIESFGHSYSGMEALVQDVANQEIRKKTLYSTFVSAVIVLILCYVVALFFSSNETAVDGISQDESSAYVPKFLMPFYSSPQ
jgi:hypothetical protein